jgi:uncharacterized protein
MSRAPVAVGLLVNGVTAQILDTQPDAVDYVEVIPEMLWVDHGPRRPHRFRPVRAAMAQLEVLAARYPIVGHGVGASIGSTAPPDRTHLAQVREWMRCWNVTAFSEHLGFARVRSDSGHVRHVGLGVPLPCDEEVLRWLIERVRVVMNELGCPILFENGVRHTPFVDEDMSEAEFINRLSDATGCSMLLDLHNLYTDCRNHQWDPFDYLDELEPEIVRELHIAGGSVLGGVYTDSHSGRCPPEVWGLLAVALSRFPHVERVTFEFNDSYYAGIGCLGVLEELAHARSMCNRAVAA